MAILRAVAINALPFPTRADSRRWNAPKAVLVLLIGTAAIQKALPALVAPCRVREESTRPPEILFCGLKPSQETKCLALGQRVMSSPHSLIKVITVAGLNRAGLIGLGLLTL